MERKHANDGNGDDDVGERPLKKAKFPWQVKGCRALKEDSSSSPSPAPPSVPETKFEDNLEMLGDYLLKQDFSSLNSLLFGPEAETSTSASTSAYPRYTPSYKQVPIDNNNQRVETASGDLDASKSSDETSTSSSYNPFNTVVKQRLTRIEDQYLKRWQARQIAKGYVDNTINRVLDSWFVAPLPPYLDDSRQLPLDVTGLLDDLAGNEGIENEGILMAISAHGLQNNQPRGRSFRSRSLSDSALNVDPPAPDDWFLVKNDPTVSDDTTKSDTSWRQFTQPCNCSNARRTADATTAITNIPFHRRNRSHDHSSQDDGHVPSVSNAVDVPNVTAKIESSDDMEEDVRSSKDNKSSSTETQFEEHFDFLDTAVSFAIQTKGLIPF